MVGCSLFIVTHLVALDIIQRSHRIKSEVFARLRTTSYFPTVLVSINMKVVRTQLLPLELSM